MTYVDKGQEPRPIIAGLGQLYEQVSVLAYPLVRVTAGAFLLAHGWPKLMGGWVGLAGFLPKVGWLPGTFWAWVVTTLETAGAACIILGLLTRPIAALLFIEFMVIAWVHSARGFSASVNGWEFPAFWALVFLAVLMRGGGPYSLDRKIGREF
jgi:putative oxidoreductase